MASAHTIERQRGAKEARQQLGVLREKWPLAFPLPRGSLRLLVRGVGCWIFRATYREDRGLLWQTKSTSGDSSKGPKPRTPGDVTSCGAET